MKEYAVLDYYDLMLWRVPVCTDVSPSGIVHVACINSEHPELADPAVQRLVHYPGSTLRHPPMMSLIDLLKDWINSYGPFIAIGTASIQKYESYQIMLGSAGFHITPLVRGCPTHGFYIS